MCVCVCARAYIRVCVAACILACVRVCRGVYVCMHVYIRSSSRVAYRISGGGDLLKVSSYVWHPNKYHT